MRLIDGPEGVRERALANNVDIFSGVVDIPILGGVDATPARGVVNVTPVVLALAFSRAASWEMNNDSERGELVTDAGRAFPFSSGATV